MLLIISAPILLLNCLFQERQEQESRRKACAHQSVLSCKCALRIYFFGQITSVSNIYGRRKRTLETVQYLEKYKKASTICIFTKSLLYTNLYFKYKYIYLNMLNITIVSISQPKCKLFSQRYRRKFIQEKNDYFY